MLAPLVPVASSNVARSGNVPTLILTEKRERQNSPAALTASERVSVSRYLESVELDHEERSAREGTTASMLAFAHASDMREAFATCFEPEEAAQAGFVFATACPAHDPALAQD